MTSFLRHQRGGPGRYLSLLLALVVTLGARSAVADEPDATPSELSWKWRRHHVADYVATGVFGVGALVTEVVPSSDVPYWTSGNGFDDAIADAFGLDNYSGRETAARISDGTLIALVAHRLIVDDVLVAWAGHGRGDVAWQMAAIDVQAMLFTLAITGGAKRAFERERPSGRDCREDPNYDRRCEQQSVDGSFFSGHTSLAFTAASLTCSHHVRMPLYGGQGDVLACVSAALAASSVGFERVLANRHYATDVLTGAAVGVVSGALLPWVSFYSRPAEDRDIARWSLSLAGHAAGGGVSLQGLF